MAIHYVKHARARFSLPRIFSYKDRIKDSVLMWENAGQRKPEFWHILRSNTNFWKYIELTHNSQLHVPYPGVPIISLTLNIFSRLILCFRIHLKPIFALCIFSMCTLLCILYRLNSFILKLTIEVIGRHCRCWIYCWFWKKNSKMLARYLEYLLWMCIFGLAKCLFDPIFNKFGKLNKYGYCYC